MKKNIACITTLLIGIGLIIIAPMLYYVGGWITGHILKWLIGNTVVNGMNYIFNTTRFTIDMLPVACGTLGVVGSFFKSTSTTTKKESKYGY